VGVAIMEFWAMIRSIKVIRRKK